MSVYLDGEYAFGLQNVVAAGLRIGQALSADEIAALKRHDESERAYEATLRYLTYRPRSRSEVQGYLARRQVAAAQASGRSISMLWPGIGEACGMFMTRLFGGIIEAATCAVPIPNGWQPLLDE